MFRLFNLGFAGDIARRLKLVEVSFIPKSEEPKKMEAKTVYEIDVDTGATY
jgi:hypothetical protein